MTAYALHSERHLIEAKKYDYDRPRDFRFAIRRRDGSLVFRTETVQLAHELLANLNGDVESVVLRDHRGRVFPGEKSAA